MEPLYKLSQHYLAAYHDLVGNPDIPDEAVTDTLAGLQGEFEEKAVNIAALILNIEADATAIKEAERNMQERRRRLENQANRLREYLLNNLQAMPPNQQKIFTPELEIKIKKCPPAVIIEAGAKIPDEYMRVIPESKEPDKAKLKEALSQDIALVGVSLVSRNKLDIS